jgi:hypothetical protein
MLIDLLKIGTLMGVIVLPLFFKGEKKVKPIKIPKYHNDTSEARYAINAHGFLEEIHHDKLPSQAN